MTGTGTGGPVVAGTRFLAVAEVYAPIEETEGDKLSDISKLDQRSETTTEVTSSCPLEHAGATGGTVVSKDTRRRSISENGAHYTDPDAIRGTLDTDQVEFPSVYRSPNGGKRTGSSRRRGRHRGGGHDYGWRGGVGSTLVPHGMD